MVTMAMRVSPLVHVPPRLGVIDTVLPGPPEPTADPVRTKPGVAAAASDCWRMFTVGTATSSATTHRMARRRPAPRLLAGPTELIGVKVLVRVRRRRRTQRHGLVRAVWSTYLSQHPTRPQHTANP